MSFSQYNPKLTLEDLRFAPEHQYLERKGRDTKPTKIANELIGMLNAGGGTLVYGIANDGTLEDLAHVGGLLPQEPTQLDGYRKLVHEFIKRTLFPQPAGRPCTGRNGLCPRAKRGGSADL